MRSGRWLVADVRRGRGADPIGYMSLGKAAHALGMPGKHAATRLRRVLLAKERECGQKIMLRSAGERNPKFIVTIPMLRQWCPELFSARDEIIAAVREHMSGLEAQIEETVERQAILAEENGLLSQRVAETEKHLGIKYVAPRRDRTRHAPVNG